MSQDLDTDLFVSKNCLRIHVQVLPAVPIYLEIKE